MSNPAKVLKKVVKAVIVVAVVAAVAYVALPALSGAGAGAGTVAGTGSFTSGSTALVAGGGGTAATTASVAAGAKGAGLLSGLKAVGSKVGGAIANADPIVQMGMIQAGSQMVAGAMTPEPQTEAERLQDQLNVYHSMPHTSRDFSAITNHSSAQPQQAQQPMPQAGLVAQNYQPVAPRNDGLLGRYNPQTRRWEPTQNA